MRSKSQAIMNDIIAFIDDYFFENNAIPTMQEIADEVGLNKSNISRYVQEMAEKGLIDTSGGWRGVKTSKINKTLSKILRVPIVGEIACGTPVLAEQNIESYLTISASFLGQGKFFALRAKGDSMINAGINDGNIVIVKVQNSAEEGQIVVARIDEETTLKRYYIDKQKRKVRLHPENDGMEDMYFDKVDVQGVVKKVIKDIE